MIPGLWVCVRDVRDHGFVAVLERRSVSEASPLVDNIHLEAPVRVEERPTFYMMADGQSLEGARERVDQWLVLVHPLRCFSVT